MKILVTGASGLVGSATVSHCQMIGDEVFPMSHQNLDISNAKSVYDVLKEIKPDSVINCAAWTDVDGCEINQEKNFAINARGVENLALGCKEIGANLVTISTDYVFDGTKSGFYTQRDDPNPQSAYGKAKLAGEQLAMANMARAIVVRTGWIFGTNGRNFLSKMPELLFAGKSIKAISDSEGTPTYAPDLAQRLRELAELDLPGIYHVTNSGEGTTYEKFAHSIPGIDTSLIESVSFADLNRPAPRPQNSKLSCLISEKFKLKPLPHWNEALAVYVTNVTAVVDK
jgi:dTDP-4-dehydrorhamnose reductase